MEALQSKLNVVTQGAHERARGLRPEDLPADLRTVACEMDVYESFLARKLQLAQPCGFEPKRIGKALFPFQQDLVRWACRRGRAAVFASTGLGKTRMQLEWARQVLAQGVERVLVLAPLAVAAQTQAEGKALGLEVTLAREQSEVRPGVSVTNYERLHRFEPQAFGGVVLDESSCIKHHTAKTLSALMDAFGQTPYRLCATATPAPNDFTELGTHAEFLGVCSRVEMLSEFFCHDGGETQVWRLKGHAKAHFWRWVASWGAMVRTPEDLGHDGASYQLPPLTVVAHTIEADAKQVFATGELFPSDVMSLTERRAARKASLEDRVAAAAKAINESKEPWLVWCELNAEADALRAAIPEAVEVRGSDDIDVKEARLRGFSEGAHRVLITKPSIAGFGLNWQHCARMSFVGLSDSWESYFQAIRRCWRFGQTRPVEVHVYASEMEGAVVRNLERKARDAEEMGEQLSRETGEAVRASVLGQRRMHTNEKHAQRLAVPAWLVSEDACQR